MSACVLLCWQHAQLQADNYNVPSRLKYSTTCTGRGDETWLWVERVINRSTHTIRDNHTHAAQMSTPSHMEAQGSLWYVPKSLEISDESDAQHVHIRYYSHIVPCVRDGSVTQQLVTFLLIEGIVSVGILPVFNGPEDVCGLIKPCQVGRFSSLPHFLGPVWPGSILAFHICSVHDPMWVQPLLWWSVVILVGVSLLHGGEGGEQEGRSCLREVDYTVYINACYGHIKLNLIQRYCVHFSIQNCVRQQSGLSLSMRLWIKKGNQLRITLTDTSRRNWLKSKVI